MPHTSHTSHTAHTAHTAYTAQTAAVMLAVVAVGCSGRSVRTTLDADARQFVRLAVALGERDPDSLDFYAGPEDLVADIRRSPPPLATIRREAAALSARLGERAAEGGGDADRARAIARTVAALQDRVDLLSGTRLPFRIESTRFFGLAPEPPNLERMAELRSQIEALVGAGGSLGDRVAAFSKRFVVEPDRLAQLFDVALAVCRQRTKEHLTLPANERITVELVRDRPWSAFSRYRGGGWSVVQINTDYRFTVDQVLQMACHEGYPGHHTRSVLLTRPESDQPERLVQLTFSPASLVSEAAASMAVDIAFPGGDRARVERDRLFAIADIDSGDAERQVAVERALADLQLLQADVARRYIDGELEFARAVSVLEQQALVPRAETVIKYVNQFRSYVITYTAGRAAFSARVAACAGAPPAADRLWSCFRELMLKPAL